MAGAGMSGTPFFDSVALGDLTLRVAELAQAQAFYQDVLGFACLQCDAGAARLAPPGAREALLVLQAAPDAPARPRGTAGLFHVALLYPDRHALGRVLRRLLDLGVPIGSADHGVSEAVYLSDPEGNGIELYADRPPEAWPPKADDQVTMFTEALNLNDLLALAQTPGPLLPEATRIGHVHLSVASLVDAERFYGDALGFAVTQRSYPGALFLARDGYHHHLGANIWRSRHAAVPGTLGLEEFTIRLSHDALGPVVTRLSDAGWLLEHHGPNALAQGPDGLRVRLVATS